MQIVFENSNLIYLNTFMTPSEFSKVRGGDRIQEKGTLATFTSAGWIFSTWSFEEAEEEGGTVLVKGKAFAGSTLKDYFARDEEPSLVQELPSGQLNKAKLCRAASLVCMILQEAINLTVPLKACGAGNIFVADDFSKVLFLPPALFESSVKRCALKEDFSDYKEEYGFYVNPLLKQKNALRFTQAVIAYRVLTKTYPFDAKNIQELENDMADQNFTPLRNMIWALDSKLSSYVDNSLSLGAALRPSGKTAKFTEFKKTAIAELSSSSANKENLSLTFPLSSLYRELGLTQNGGIPSDGRLLPVIRKSDISNEAFDAIVKKESLQRARALKTKRFIKKNKTNLISAAIALAVVLIASFSAYNTYLSRPTTKGLDSFKTAEIFYSSYNNLNMNNAQCSVKGKQLNSILDAISQIFVANQARGAYRPSDSTVTPAEWMNYNHNGTYYMYGLSGFTLNGRKGELFAKPPLNSSYPTPLKEENGRSLKDKSTTQLSATYYLVHSEAGEETEQLSKTIYIEEFSDIVKLEFDKDRWRITEIEQTQKKTFAQDFDSFYKDYNALMKKNSEEIILVANELRSKYPWIPDNSEILSAAQKMKEAFE